MADLGAIDLPLLLALQSLLATNSVTASARALGRSQPSMSRTLGRLRTILGDPLFVAVGRTLRPTPRALALRPVVADLLDAMRRLTAPTPAFVPQAERRTVRIAAADYATVVLLDGWIAALRQEAPGIVVDVTPVDASSIDPLARGELDLAIAPRLAAVGLDQFVARELFSDRAVCVMRRGHPWARRPLRLADYLALEHVMIGSVLPPVSSVDEALHRLRRTRTIVARMPSVVSALMLVAASDVVATSWARIVPYLGPQLVARPLPFAVAPLELHVMWHPRETASAFHRWLRESLIAHARANLTASDRSTASASGRTSRAPAARRAR